MGDVLLGTWNPLSEAVEPRLCEVDNSHCPAISPLLNRDQERACVPPCSHICPTSTRSIPVQETLPKCRYRVPARSPLPPQHPDLCVYQCPMPTQGLYSIYSFQHEKAALQAIMATRKILHKGLTSWCDASFKIPLGILFIYNRFLYENTSF